MSNSYTANTSRSVQEVVIIDLTNDNYTPHNNIVFFDLTEIDPPIIDLTTDDDDISELSLLSSVDNETILRDTSLMINIILFGERGNLQAVPGMCVDWAVVRNVVGDVLHRGYLRNQLNGITDVRRVLFGNINYEQEAIASNLGYFYVGDPRHVEILDPPMSYVGTAYELPSFMDYWRNFYFGDYIEAHMKYFHRVIIYNKAIQQLETTPNAAQAA